MKNPFILAALLLASISLVACGEGYPKSKPLNQTFDDSSQADPQ